MTHPVERRSDYKHITATWTKLVTVAGIFTMLGGAVVWLGGTFISPGANVSALAQRLDSVEDDHGTMRRYVGWLVVVECERMEPRMKLNLEAAGLSCAQVLQDLRRGNSH